MREDCDWCNNLVICAVARFARQKNHSMLLGIFKEILSMHPNAILVLVGAKTGLYDKIQKLAQDMHIASNVQFLGARNDVHEILQAVDVICMPSIYEGLSVSMVEAQAAGLRIITSDQVPREAEVIPGAIRFLPLTASLKTWAHAVLEPYERRNTQDSIRAAGFDVKENARWLQNYYLENSNQSCRVQH